MSESIICYCGLTVFWGEHLEHHTKLTMDFDTFGEYIENMILGQFLSTLRVYGYTFLVLVDGVPFDWNFRGVL